MENSEHKISKENVRKIHEMYIGSFLIMIIVILLTVKFSDNQALVDRVNFAAAISSLILAVLAIVYAVYSTHSMNSSIVSIASAATTVGESASRISNASAEVAVNADKLSEATKALTEKIDNNSQDLREIRNNIIGMTQSKASSNLHSVDINNNDYEGFLQKSSLFGLYALLIAVKSSEQNIEVNGTDLFGDLSISRDYAYGFITAAASAGVVGSVSITYPDRIKVSGASAVKYEIVKEATLRRINELGLQNPDQLKIMQDAILKIEEKLGS